MFEDLKREIERNLGFNPGTLDHIPLYAIHEVAKAIRNVRDLEKTNLFRPGLYYIVLSDLCRSTEVATRLGSELNKKRVETFIMTCVEALGTIKNQNYSLFLREIGDAVLIIFSSFADVHTWWKKMESELDGRNLLWYQSLPREQFRQFFLQAKTVVHAGEVVYSDNNIPVAVAVNQVFKIEKLFKARELGATEIVHDTAAPVLRDLGIQPIVRQEVLLPGDEKKAATYLLAKVDALWRTEPYGFPDTFGENYHHQKDLLEQMIVDITSDVDVPTKGQCAP
ncbi:MAG TPA: hypothetical protein PKD54_04325 [Pirellulaceae bacterium]|nr:hypothetical protein [Pirellulaceae bacterium]